MGNFNARNQRQFAYGSGWPALTAMRSPLALYLKYKTYFTTCEGVKIPAVVRASTFPPSHGEATLANGLPSTCCDGFYSDDDDRRHAILADASGQITELFFHPKFGHGQALLLKRSAVVDVGAFYTSDDGYRHVAVATADGSIAEVFYSPKTGVGAAELGHVPNATRVCGLLRWSAAQALVRATVTTLYGVSDIGAFYSADDNTVHCVCALKTGEIREFFYRA